MVECFQSYPWQPQWKHHNKHVCLAGHALITGFESRNLPSVEIKYEDQTQSAAACTQRCVSWELRLRQFLLDRQAGMAQFEDNINGLIVYNNK
jgi:hypothetical protein